MFARMELMREKWTDERLDDLNTKVDAGFNRLDLRIDEVGRRLNGMDGRLDRLYRVMLGLGGLIVAVGGLVIQQG